MRGVTARRPRAAAMVHRLGGGVCGRIGLLADRAGTAAYKLVVADHPGAVAIPDAAGPAPLIVVIHG
jgi:hypothetical protein